MNEEKDEIADRINEYTAFLDALFDKRNQLQRFSNGMKGLRETAVKIDAKILKDVEEFLNAKVEEISKMPLEKLPKAEDLAKSLGMELLENFEKVLKDRRTIDKHFDIAIEKFLEAISDIDKVVKDKIVELLQNIENTHSYEMNKLKIQIADLVAQNEELRRENEAIKQGLKPKPKEIPQLPALGKKSIQCPICLQIYEVDQSTSAYECKVCGYKITVDSLENK